MSLCLIFPFWYNNCICISMMNDIFNTIWGPLIDQSEDLCIEEKKDYYLINLVVAGIKKEEIDLGIDSDFLVVKCSPVHSNLIVRPLTKKLKLPGDVDTTNIIANLNLGILTIKIFKKGEEQRKIKIEEKDC